MEDYTELLNQQIFAIDTVWVALCAALIFFMEAGFALLEAGFVRSKNAMSIIAKVIIDITFGGIALEKDGCPITDRDEDGINDENDSCPDEPGNSKNNGCPDNPAAI